MVDSENSKNINNDSWRLNQVEKATSLIGHPYSKFTVGNLKTLQQDPAVRDVSVRDELVKFHSRFYSSNFMTACLYSNQSLESLENLSVDYFSKIPNKNLSKLSFKRDPFGEENLATIKYIVPIAEIKTLHIVWAVADYRDFYESNPTKYLSFLLSYECENSLVSRLKHKGLINSLSAYSVKEARGFELFNIAMDLTENGLENLNAVIKLVLQFLNMVKYVKPVKYIFDELTELGRIKFTFKDKEKPISLVSVVAHDLHIYAMEHILMGNYYATKFNPELVESLCNFLIPEKMRISVLAKRFKDQVDKVEKWYNVDYKVEKISQEQMEKFRTKSLNMKLRLPLRNVLIPSDFKILHDSSDEEFSISLTNPDLIFTSQLSQLWYKRDYEFKLPKALFKFQIRNSIAYYDPKCACMTKLFAELLNDYLKEKLFQANLAGYVYSITSSYYGIVLTLFGYSDKIDLLLELIFDHIVKFKVNEKRFGILKEIVSQ